MYKQAEKPKTQLLLLFCATPVVIISLVILIAFYISLWQPNNEWTEDLTQLISATIFSTALIVLLIAEYYSIISRSEGGAVTAFIICMAPTFLFLVWLMNRTVELLGIVQPAERPNAGASIKPPILLFIIIYFVISALISLGHFRWYLKIRKYNSKILLSKDDVEYIGFGPRLAAAFTDVFIFFLLFGIVMFASLPYSFKIRSPFPLVFENLIFTALGIFFVVKFGGTPGKLILGIRIVNENRKFITVGAAILRIILYLPSFVIYFLKMRYVFANIPLTESFQTQQEFSEAIKLYGGIYSSQIITIILLLIPIADAMFILFTDKKRAAHDFLAGSYVVSKESCVKTEVKKPGKVLTNNILLKEW